MWSEGFNLTTPVNVTAAVASDTQVNVSWDQITGETGYFLDYSTDSSFPTGGYTTRESRLKYERMRRRVVFEFAR